MSPAATGGGGMVTVGFEELRARLSKAGAQAPVMLARLLTVEAHEIMAKSKPLVPVDLGVLRASGKVLPPVIAGTAVTITMGYGGPAAAYALVQHERLDYHHTTGQAKYLEQPFMEHVATLGARLLRHFGQVFG